MARAATANSGGVRELDPTVLEGEISNAAKEDVELNQPYGVHFTIEGTSTLLFHRWSNEAVAEKAAAKKGSAEKKTDNLASYVYRDEEDRICLPGKYVRGAIIEQARSIQDPRSPRRSAKVLYQAGIQSLTELAPMIVKGKPTTHWDMIDEQRVTVQRNGITRQRPAFMAGWRATFFFNVLTPEYINLQKFREVLSLAGLLVGVADYRPTYGRFQVTMCELIDLSDLSAVQDKI